MMARGVAGERHRRPGREGGTAAMVTYVVLLVLILLVGLVLLGGLFVVLSRSGQRDRRP
jgi:hypothetical protein